MESKFLEVGNDTFDEREVGEVRVVDNGLVPFLEWIARRSVKACRVALDVMVDGFGMGWSGW
jgi:hypothetical protein